jgi:hypothetical protein
MLVKSAYNLNIRMQLKALSYLLLLQTIAVLVYAQWFDLPRIREIDLYDDDAPTISERLHAAENEDHPMLTGGRIQDVKMQILKDFNHVLPFKFGNSN